MHRPLICTEEEKTIELGMQKEGNDLLIAAEEAAREYAQSLTDIDRTNLWDWTSQE